MTNMKRAPIQDGGRQTQSVDAEDRVLKICTRVIWLLFIILLIASSRSRAAELDCLVKPEMYVELSSPVDSIVEEILVDTGGYRYPGTTTGAARSLGRKSQGQARPVAGKVCQRYQESQGATQIRNTVSFPHGKFTVAKLGLAV